MPVTEHPPWLSPEKESRGSGMSWCGPQTATRPPGLLENGSLPLTLTLPSRSSRTCVWHVCPSPLTGRRTKNELIGAVCCPFPSLLLCALKQSSQMQKLPPRSAELPQVSWLTTAAIGRRKEHRTALVMLQREIGTKGYPYHSGKASCTSPTAKPAGIMGENVPH